MARHDRWRPDLDRLHQVIVRDPAAEVVQVRAVMVWAGGGRPRWDPAQNLTHVDWFTAVESETRLKVKPGSRVGSTNCGRCPSRSGRQGLVRKASQSGEALPVGR